MKLLLTPTLKIIDILLCIYIMPIRFYLYNMMIGVNPNISITFIFFIQKCIFNFVDKYLKIPKYTRYVQLTFYYWLLSLKKYLYFITKLRRFLIFSQHQQIRSSSLFIFVIIFISTNFKIFGHGLVNKIEYS